MPRPANGVNETISELNRSVSGLHGGQNDLQVSELTSNTEKSAIQNRRVEKAKEYIVAGDAIQVVLSQRFEGRVSGQDFRPLPKPQKRQSVPLHVLPQFRRKQVHGGLPRNPGTADGRPDRIAAHRRNATQGQGP